MRNKYIIFAVIFFVVLGGLAFKNSYNRNQIAKQEKKDEQLRNELKIYDFSLPTKSTVDESITLSANVRGKDVKYKYYYIKDDGDDEVTVQDYSQKQTCRWCPHEIGKYKFYVSIKNDSEELTSNSATIDIISKESSEESRIANEEKATAQSKKNREEEQKYAGITERTQKEVLSGSGDKLGYRGEALFDRNKITEQSLVNFYNDYIKNSGYNYYTLIDSSDRTKGIVFTGCFSSAIYGTIDNTGGVTNGIGDITIENSRAIYTKR